MMMNSLWSGAAGKERFKYFKYDADGNGTTRFYCQGWGTFYTKTSGYARDRLIKQAKDDKVWLGFTDKKGSKNLKSRQLLFNSELDETLGCNVFNGKLYTGQNRLSASQMTSPAVLCGLAGNDPWAVDDGAPGLYIIGFVAESSPRVIES